MKYKSKYLYLIIIVSFIVLTMLSLFLVLCRPQIKLNGDKTITLNLNEEYKELGAYTKNAFQKLKYKIKITNNIDNKKIGTYEVIYQINYHGQKIKKIRKVKIVDNIEPIIELSGDLEINICPNHEYQEPGFTANDNYDGDLTDKVQTEFEKISETEFKVKYYVQDKSKNEYQTYRTYTISDTESPTITLKGADTLTILKDSTYNEYGYTASDNCDGDITDKVKIESNLDTTKTGTYQITYKVTDSNNNETSVTRTIKVITTDPARNQVYLTFDDGPSSLTSQVLDILKEENVKATFFINNFADASIIKRIVNEGHTIAIHGYSHDYKTAYSSVDAYMNNITKLRNRIKDYTGVDTKIIRFLGGSSNTVSNFNPGIMTKLTKKVLEEGYFYYDWNVSSGDATSKPASADDIYNNVVNNLRYNRHNIVLMHDSNTKKNTVSALRNIINYGKSHGYTFNKITENTPMIHHNVNN